MNVSSRRRLLLFGLILTANALNLIDRQIISVLKPMISNDLGWNDQDYGHLVAWFQAASAAGYLVTGWIVDRLGIKWANPLAVAAWSLAAFGHGLASSVREFIVCRIALGATEAMGTPANIKTIATVFKPAQRALGIGLNNAVATFGVVLAPLAIPAVAVVWGWRYTFIFAGGVGLCWSALWLVCTRGIHFARSATNHADRGSILGGYVAILSRRSTWTIAIAKTVTDATFWFMLFWLPDFFHRAFGLSGVDLGRPVAIGYAGSALGALLAGALSSALLSRGLTENAVRKSVMLGSALMVVPLLFILHIRSYSWTLSIVSLALAGHQGFSVSLFAMISDTVPGASVGKVTSFCSFAGNLGGMAIALIAGMVLADGLGYFPLFLFASTSYLMALVWIQMMLAKIEPVSEDTPVTSLADAGARLTRRKRMDNKPRFTE